MLAAYKSEGDPEKYEEAYADLKRFVEGALDIYKVFVDSNWISPVNWSVYLIFLLLFLLVWAWHDTLSSTRAHVPRTFI